MLMISTVYPKSFGGCMTQRFRDAYLLINPAGV